MKPETFFGAFVMLLVLIDPVSRAGVSREATITGLGGNGTCTVEVNVDGAAEVEVSGNMGYLTTISGQPALWRRFQCNAPLPRDPADFQLARVGGRGFVRLVRDPRGNGGRALIRIDDPNPGRGGYTFDLQWRDPRGGAWPPMQHPPGPGRGPGGFPPASSVLACQDAVGNRLRHDGYSYITFDRTLPSDWRNDWISGTVKAGRGEYESTWFLFSCSVDFYGKVRSVDLRRR